MMAVPPAPRAQNQVPSRLSLKKTAFTTLQVVLTLAILFLVFRDPQKRVIMLHALRHADHWWLLAGFTVYGLVEIIAGIRWRILLQVQEIALSWPRLIALLLIGVFFNFFIPGGTGGDVVKVFYLLKETPGKGAQALLSVVVDRLIGIVSLAAIAIVVVVTRWSWLTSVPGTKHYVVFTLIVLGSSLAGLHFTYILSKHGWVHRLPKRFPGREKLAELASAYNLYGRAWQASLVTFVLSIIANLGYFGTFYCAARAFHDAGTKLPTLGELCAIMPIVNTIAAMPITVGGLGVREKLFEIFFGQLCGVNPAVAVVMSSTGYLLTLAWGIVGGVIYMFYRPSEHARLREIKAQVAGFKHQMAEEKFAHETAAEIQNPQSKIQNG